ncbi:MAG: ribosome biogenesis GTPase RsgA [Treponema sp. CETP13]|nr:MAG: ribosome biogenesis GTPase RsgA [Treponema sp. CETP13]
MDIKVNAVGFDLDKDQQALIDKKLQRLMYADELIVSLTFKVTEDKKYKFEILVNFRWGLQAHVTEENYEFAAGVNKIIDVIDHKIKKEKDKIQEKGK